MAELPGGVAEDFGAGWQLAKQCVTNLFRFDDFVLDEPVREDLGGVDGAGKAGAAGWKDVEDAVVEVSGG